MRRSCRVGVDVGGTFTDVVLWDEDTAQEYVHKVSSTPDDPGRAIVEGVLGVCEIAGRSPAQLDLIVHGTTVATNMMIQRTGARIGLITTAGFRDVMHIGRKKRPYNFSHTQEVPWQSHPLVPRRDRHVVTERIGGPDGAVVTPLAEEEVRVAVERLREAGVDGVAVCFLFSFLNPDHERRAAQIVRELMPNAFVSASHEIVPLHREYERFSTTAVNVYVGPGVAGYIGDLQRNLAAAEVTAGVRLMTSSGGVATTSYAAERPVELLMSGPAAGLLAGIRSGRSAGSASVITLDVGGTSSDIGVAAGGELRMKHLLDTSIRDYQVMVPMVDVETIGAGGGSIARVSDLGVLEVGPGSAGASPGPVCYGRGGRLPTTSDAAAVLGWLRPSTFFGGRLRLDVAAAAEAIRIRVAEPLGLSVEEAALGIHTVAAHSMSAAIVELSVRRGHDPREFALVAQGGAGPLFGCAVAAEIAAGRLIVPPHPGLASAHGLLDSDLRYEVVRPVWTSTSDPDLAALDEAVAGLRAEAEVLLGGDGVPRERMRFEVLADCRYHGQGYELRVPTPGETADEAWLAGTVAAFHDQHEATYRSRFPEKPVQVVNVRVVGTGLVSHRAEEDVVPGSVQEPAPVATIKSWFRVEDQPRLLSSRVYDRATLVAGSLIEGPAVVEQPDSTTVVDPGWSATTDAAGNLVVTRSPLQEDAS